MKRERERERERERWGRRGGRVTRKCESFLYCGVVAVMMSVVATEEEGLGSPGRR
jgi:hypothetical protein